MWGLSIKTKERLEPKAGRGLRFGVVVTLREMNGENSIDEFIKMCMMRGWVVSRLDVHTQLMFMLKLRKRLRLSNEDSISYAIFSLLFI